MPRYDDETIERNVRYPYTEVNVYQEGSGPDAQPVASMRVYRFVDVLFPEESAITGALHEVEVIVVRLLLRGAVKARDIIGT